MSTHRPHNHEVSKAQDQVHSHNKKCIIEVYVLIELLIMRQVEYNAIPCLLSRAPSIKFVYCLIADAGTLSFLVRLILSDLGFVSWRLWCRKIDLNLRRHEKSFPQ